MTVRVGKNRRADMARSASDGDMHTEGESSRIRQIGKQSQMSSLQKDGIATRSITAGRKIRRCSGMRKTAKGVPNVTSQREVRDKRVSESRKSFESLPVGRFELSDSLPNKRGQLIRSKSATLRRRQYNPSTEETSSDSSDSESEGSLSLGSQPPPEREIRISPRAGPLNLSLTSLSLNASMDLSRHGALPVYDPITTSATGEKWARFKLLGRMGLGTVELSHQAHILVERNFEIMLRAIKHIYALRDAENDDISVESVDAERVLDIRTGHLLEEVHETIHVPEEGPARLKRDPEKIVVREAIQAQLRDYITVISSMYRDNPFHDFEHASTVLQAVDKLINLVKPPDDAIDYKDLRNGCGVATEPWNHFALVFSALIHDVDHNGVPNAQLIKERAHVAGAYKNRSVAEQNSIELAWNLLMEPCYKELRESVFLFRSEMSNFRSLVVTAVMATDIADKELKALRSGRAAEALEAEEKDEEANMDLVSRKATFVVETLIQVADVSHTMSAFDKYKIWNHRLYKEMYAAYRNGRAECDPTVTWYKGEFGFFDFYIIPLAKKLNDCGIPVEASREYISNAIKNRKIWEKRGEFLLDGFVKERREEDEARVQTLSLHDMAIDTSTSGESSTDHSFASESDSSGAGAAPNNRDKQRMQSRSTRSHRSTFSVLSMQSLEDHNLIISGKVPSKASGSSRHSRKIVFKSKSSDVSNDESLSPSSSKRSCSSASASKARSRSNSPGSASDRSNAKVQVKKNRSRSISPASGRESSNTNQTKPKMRGRRPSRSVSPGSNSELPLEREKSVTEVVIRKGKRFTDGKTRSPSTSPGSPSQPSKPTVALRSKSRSRSPGSGTELGSRPRRPKLRGRRPDRSVSPSSGTENASRDDGESVHSQAARKGKRPSRKIRETSASPGSPSIHSKPRLLYKVLDRNEPPGDTNEKKESKLKKGKPSGRKTSSSVSPGRSVENPTEKKTKKKKGKKLGKGRKPSRSASPVTNSVDGSDTQNAKVKKKKKSSKGKTLTTGKTKAELTMNSKDFVLDGQMMFKVKSKAAKARS